VGILTLSGREHEHLRVFGLNRSRRTDLLHLNATTMMFMNFAFKAEDGHEEEAIYGAADHWVSEGGGGWNCGEGTLSQARLQ